MKVRIRNYQIIDEATLEFTAGLNIIVGETNNGKSSIFRAIESAIFNELGDSFIKKGKAKSTVGIQDGENTVIWKKRRNKSPSTVYKINGEEYKKVGRTQVDEVRDVLNIGEIKLTSKSKEMLNFWRQMKYPFLLDKTAGQLFEFLSLSSEDNNLTEVVKDMRSDLKDINREVDKVEGGIDALKEVVREEEDYLNSKDGFEGVYKQVIDMQSDINKLEDLKEDLVGVNLKKNNLYKFKEISNKLSEVTDVVIPKCNQTENKLSKFILLKSKIKKLNKSIDNIEKGKGILERQKRILDNINIKSLEGVLNDYHNIKSSLRGLYEYVNSLEEKDGNISKVNSNLSKINSKLNEVELEPLGNLLNDYSEKKTGLDKLSEIYSSIIEINSSKSDLERLLTSIQDEMFVIEDEMESFDICPLCDSELE